MSMKGTKDLLRILDDNRVLSSGPWSSFGRIVWGYGTNCGDVYRYEARPSPHYNWRRVDLTIHAITPQQAYRITSALGLGRLKEDA